MFAKIRSRAPVLHSLSLSQKNQLFNYYSLKNAQACNEFAGLVSASFHMRVTQLFSKKMSQQWRAVCNTLINLTVRDLTLDLPVQRQTRYRSTNRPVSLFCPYVQLCKTVCFQGSMDFQKQDWHYWFESKTKITSNRKGANFARCGQVSSFF